MQNHGQVMTRILTLTQSRYSQYLFAVFPYYLIDVWRSVVIHPLFHSWYGNLCLFLLISCQFYWRFDNLKNKVFVSPVFLYLFVLLLILLICSLIFIISLFLLPLSLFCSFLDSWWLICDYLILYYYLSGVNFPLSTTLPMSLIFDLLYFHFHSFWCISWFP